MIQIFRLTFR